MLRPVADGVSVLEIERSLLGLQLGGRATALALQGGGVLLHSPVPLTSEDVEALRAQGGVRHLVGPNLGHHLFLGHARQHFPEAKLHGVPGLAKKRKDLAFDAEVNEAPIDPSLRQVVIGGMPSLSEVAFLHVPSRTLVLCDLFFHFLQSPSLLTRGYLKASGAWGGLGQTMLHRAWTKDRAAYRASIERLLDLDFDRIVVAHGQLLERGGKEALRATLA